MASGRDPSGETERLCRFLATMEIDDVARPVIDHAKSMVLDTLGVTVAGLGSDPATLARGTTTLRSGGDGPRLVGTDLSGPADDVAFAGGVASHALDFDDVHHTMGGHPSAPVLSALLPAAERSGASGAAVLEAFVAGCETAVMLANVLNPGHYERGWHPTAVVGTVGAAAAVGVLLGLDADRLRHAVGVAASGAGGLKANFGTMTKPYHVGNAARTGLEAADLAAEGFTANPDVLEASFGGFCDLFEGDPPHDFADHGTRLGDPWKIRDPPVTFKAYPCCGSTHAAIDGALALRSGHDLDPASIERIEVTEHSRRLDHTDRPNPDGGLDAKFSVQYCVAVALRHGDVWLDHFDPGAVDAEIDRSLVDRVGVRRDAPRFADMEWGAEVRVRTADGTERTELVPAPRGSAENPLTADELEAKYRRCLAPRIDEHDVHRSVSLVRELDAVNDVRTVVDSVTTG